jgi:YebC/PmpR family DNA-binding regulatory protein
MAGHSHAKNIMFRKAAQDAKKTKIFTRFALAIKAAVKKGGNDSNLNPVLRNIIKQALNYGLTKEIISRAIEKQDKELLDEVMYEGYIQGVAILVETITNNKNKTAAEIRSIFSKYGGSMVEPNGAAFLFDKRGIIECDLAADKFFELVMQADAIDATETVAIFELEKFDNAQIIFEAMPNFRAEICYIPKSHVECDNIESFHKFLGTLEDNEDTQACWHNLKRENS